MKKIPDYIKTVNDAEKINYVLHHNLNVTVHLDSDNMYMIFNDLASANRLDFDNRLPNTQYSQSYLSELGLEVNFS